MGTLLHAQTVTVQGVVRDAEGAPVAGAVVRQAGNDTGTFTGADGAFSLAVSGAGATLEVTMLGYLTREVALGGRTSVEITLEHDSVMVEDVVVTALGIRRQARALGYAISEVDNDAITAGREGNAILALSGKVAGVDINMGAGGPSGSTRVLIRGNSQLSGSNLPLYVVDGVPLENSQLGSAGQWGGYDFGDGLGSINPEDIETISVLKGASAAALYGSRASNGVVLITTKRAGRDEGLGIEFSTNLNAVMLARSFDDYQREYGQGRDGRLILEENDASGSTQSAWGAKLDPSLSIPIYNGQIKPYANVNNNVLSFFRTGWTTTNSIAVSKAFEEGDFRFSISDMRNTDIVPNSDMSRTTFMFKGSAKLGRKIRVEARGNYSTEYVNNRPALSDSPNNIGNSLIGIAPNFDQKWLASDYKDENGNYNEWNGNAWRINPYWALNEMTNKSTKDRLMGHVQFNYDFLPHFSFQARAGTDFYKFRMTEFVPVDTPNARLGSMTENSIDVYENNFEGMISYNQEFGNLGVSAFVGGNIMQFNRESFTNSGSDQVDPNAHSILNYNTQLISWGLGRKQVNSAYGAVNLSWKDYLYLDATIRNDVTSTLSADNRSYWYPSVSGSFVFSSLLNLERGALSFGKIRASWANVGGDTDPYRLDLTYNKRDYTFGSLPLGTIAVTGIPNRAIRPTQTYSYEVGVDLRFFTGRLMLDAGYYHTSTIDQILNLPISAASGYRSKTINAGKITNAGIEVSLTGIPVRTRDFEWTSTVNLSKNVNKVVELHPEAQNYELASARWAGAYIYAMAGEAYGVIMGKRFARDPNGNRIFENGLPTYDSQLAVLGNGNYDFIMGWGNTFTYKGFRLGFLLDMKWGADLFSMTAMQAHSNGTSKETLEGRKEWYESEELRQQQNIREENWTPTGGYLGNGVMWGELEDGTEGWVPNNVFVNPQDYWGNINENSPEPYIYDASYIKLRELSFSYDVPSRLLRGSFVKGISVTAYARNLWLIYSPIPNIDPESNYNNGNGQGFEYGSLPSRRTMGLGLTLKF
jgi:TonB-linked SusC/RagA family outer membrane protein